MNELYIENGQIAGLSEEEKETTLGGGLARFEAPEVADSEQMAAEFNAAAAKARRERHLSAVLNAQLYGRGNKEIDALVDEFADAKGLTAYDNGRYQTQEDKDMRLGGKVARDFNDGDVWGTLKGLEGRIPEEEREAWRMELRGCDTPEKGKILLGKTLRGMAEKRWQKMEEERKEAEGIPEAVKGELADYVISGKFSPELMGKIDKFKAMDALAPSLERARAAYAWLMEMQHGGEKGEYEARVKQEADRLEEEWKNGVHARWDAERTREDFIQQAKANVGESYEITRNDILQLVELLKDEDGKLDEGALAGVVLALNRDAEGQQSIDSRFIRNFVEGGKRWFMSTADWMNRNNARNGFIWTGPDTAPIYLTKEQQEEFQAEYSPDVEKALDGLRQLEDARLSAADKSIWYSKVASGLGTIAGQNIPFFASAALGGNIGMLAGTAAMFPDIANREIGSAYARGEKHPELVGNITGLMQAGAEGMFGRLAGGNKLVGRLLDKGAAGLVSVPVLGKALSAIQGNALMRYVAGSGVVEGAGELFIEDATAETLSYLTLGGLRKLGVDIKEQEFAPLGHAWENFKEDPYQAAATVAYCMIMGAFGAGHIMRSAKEFAMRTEVTQAAGLKAASARRLAQMAQSETVTEEEFKKEAMRLYEDDVINGDPVELKKRLEAQGKKFLEQAEVLMYARSGVRDYILKESGILEPEQNGDGTYHVVRQVKDAEGKEQTVESDWTEEQLNAYVAMRRGSMMEEAMRELQARMQGLAMAQAEMSEEERAKGEIIALQNVPTAALAELKKNGGRITYNVMKALAAEAAAKVEGYVAEGMSREEAEGQESAVRGVSLRSLMGAAAGFKQRVEAMQGTAEGKALGITLETASTAVFRLGGMSAGQSVLLYNRGQVNEREIVEDFIERDLGAEVTEAGQMQELGRLLKRVEEGLMKIDKGMRLLPEGKESYTRQDIVEAFSTLAQSHFLLNHGRYNMPQEAHDSIEYVQKKLADAQHLVAISRAWDAFAKSKEGREFIKREGATLEKLMEESGASVAGHYAAAKLDATVFEAVREAYEEGSSITRAAEVLEEYAKEQEELDHPAAPEEAEKIAAADSPTGEEITQEAQEDAPAVDEETGDFEAPEGTEKEQGDRGAGLVNGMYAEAGDGSVYGVARVEDLSISADVPQFKKKEVAGQREAANEDGTTHELSGGWNAKSAPIIVWRRRDGRLEVISGRHRLAHAKKNGVGHIAVRVYDEDAAHDAAWAKLYDVEVNILEGMCNAIDVAFYFRHNPMSIAEAEARGLMPKTQAGGQTAASRMGIMIATRASGYVFDSLVNGGVSAEDAYMACVITESAEGQELALKARRGTKGKKRSWEYVTALVRGAEQMAPEGGGSLTDLFGFDEGFAKRAEKMANYVEAVRKQLRRRIDVLSGAGSLQRKGEMTREMGVKIDRPEDAVKIIERLAKLDAAYEAMDPGLGIVEAAEAWDGKSEPDLRLTIDDLRFGDERASRGEGSFSVSPSLRVDIHKAYENEYGEKNDVPLCSCPALFRMLGLAEAPIVTRQHTVRKLRLTHKLTEEQIVEAVQRFDDPLGVIVENADSVIILPGMLGQNATGEQSDMMAAIHLQRARNGAHFMASLYPLDNLQKIEMQLQQGNLRYCKYNAKALANVSSNASGGTMTPALVRLLIHQGFNEDTIIGSGDVKGDVSFSVTQARERGLMRDGKLEAENGVIVDGGADFSASVDFSHVSRALFRRPDREHVGSGEGAQMYGWGVIYGAESPEVNRFYHKSFSGFVVRTKFTKDGEPISIEEVKEELKRCGVDDEKFLESIYETAPGFAVTREHLEKVRAIFVHSLKRDINILPKKFLKEAKNKIAFIDYMLENKVGMTVEREFRNAVNYRMRADVDDGNLLHWDEDGADFLKAHPDVAKAIEELPIPADKKYQVKVLELRTGKAIYSKLQLLLGSPRAASEWLDEHGIRGVKYADGVTRKKEEDKTYNYVIFNPDYIEVIAINNRHAWSEYSEDNPDWQKPEEVDFSASVAMWKGTLGVLRESFPEKDSRGYYEDLTVCPTPAVMRMVGVRPWDMVITPAVIEKVTVGKHAVPYEALEQLPEAMADPVCIAVSDTANSIEVITELKEGDDNILVAVRLDSSLTVEPQIKVNRIVSLYGKEKIAKLLTHPMLYWDETKAPSWISTRGLQLPTITDLESASNGRVLTRQDLVKYKVASGQSFSVRGEGLLDRVNLREMAEEEKMSRLMTRARRSAARWRRVFMDDKTSAADAARALGEVSSVMEAVFAYLPAGERPSYAGKMRLVEAYARLVETGRVWHRENAKSEGARAKQEVLDEVMGELEKVSTVKGEALRELREGYVREVAGRKLSEVAVSMVEDAVDAVERHLVRREMDVVKRMAEALKPKKLKSGKPAPGKMSAAGYRRFAKYMKMVEMSAAEKAERMEELAGKLDKESEAEGQEPIEEEMRELATFGALGSGRLAEARRGVRELVGFVRAERASWEGRVELEKEQMRHFARVAVEAMGGVDRNKLAERRDRAKKPLRTILGTQKGFMSLGQMWMAMQGVPALREMAEWSLERLARGNVALGMRERALREAEVAFMAKELGLTSEAARNNFLVDLKKERATGVRKAGEKRVHKVRVTVEEAREIVAMNF